MMTTSPARLAESVKLGGGVLLLIIAVLLGLAQQFAFALPAAVAGLALVRGSWRGAVKGGGQRRSSVRSAGLEMSLDHETGALDGRVLVGRHEGRLLSQMSFTELRDLAGELAGDEESLRLLEGYLDRAHPRWRDDMETDADRGRGPAGGAGGMSAQEAYEILGLEPGAGETEIRDAHRRLMKQVHPDRGGSAALAARINQAKETLLGKQR
ncbi:DnaJ domain-containing protein [Afifella pfennigii]|uniref:DnaJ domain-containing protein n=1 Tax=Afifella pfennigii TaxID=209897 RepID=UPI001FE01711|nr:DnaJ domain-containing protein [Afifella pfennigii]